MTQLNQKLTDVMTLIGHDIGTLFQNIAQISQDVAEIKQQLKLQNRVAETQPQPEPEPQPEPQPVPETPSSPSETSTEQGKYLGARFIVDRQTLLDITGQDFIDGQWAIFYEKTPQVGDTQYWRNHYNDGRISDWFKTSRIAHEENNTMLRPEFRGEDMIDLGKIAFGELLINLTDTLSTRVEDYELKETVIKRV